MRTIKTRSAAEGIKVLDKSVDLSKRMKDSYIRTRERAVDTQTQRHASPVEYASDSVQDTASGVSLETVSFLPKPRRLALKNIEQVNRRVQEGNSKLLNERQRAAEQVQKTVHKIKSDAESFRKTAERAKDTARKANSAVEEAKHALRETRQAGRNTLREVKQKAKTDLRSFKARGMVNGTDRARIAPMPQSVSLQGGNMRPHHLNNSVSVSKVMKDAGSSANQTAKGIKATGKSNIKTVKKTVKTAEQAAKQTIKTVRQSAKTAQKTAQAAAKAAKAAERAARAAKKAAQKAVKVAVRATIATVRAMIAAVRGLVTLIAAFGWIAVLVILIVCMIALLVGSVFGVFFSGEADPDTGQTINSVIAEIDADYTGQIDAITAATAYDLLDMSGARALWKHVLAVYTVRTVTDPLNPMEVATVDDKKSAILRAVFWDMNTINHLVDYAEVEVDVLDDDGLPTGETAAVTHTVLRITVNRRTMDEMAALYGFTDDQIDWLAELLKPEYHNLWNALLYGVTSIGDGSIIEIAETQLGNVGGETYWRWYGFASREDWCACFVSWCAFHAGHIDAGIIPRFSSCAVGIQWFKDRDQWHDGGYTPSPGDLIFFDWESDGTVDHVGIVERVEGEYVRTIEGNSSDSVRRRSYRLDSEKIVGYGVPEY